ncbi:MULTISPECIES: hydantoinase/carbamoylase family amidase [unclassified Campylobacter]|uniref:hydantoinase/carbamoylase family amidase n=1 Tax=unclassified Campylobacter TaxID=2593542 RepID=UPI001D9B5A07|nr:hydantoinase/carbamoylase family amidase [Campylobacter sp. RM9331]MBZ8005310.1 hydantoinase/carbamoylase family amidase [Campylobacter sp. RM9332]
MKILADDIKFHINNLAKITETNRPFTRLVFTNTYEEGRKYIKNHFLNLGLNVIYDDFANMLAIKNGKSNECIIIGSHSDTVASGGRFDGVLGVVSAMVIATALKDIQLDKTLIFCDYLGEEPNYFGLSCVGSRGMSGNLSKEQLDIKVNDTKLSDMIIKSGGNKSFRTFNELGIGKLIESYELHIEQGNMLESLNTKIGIVNKIVGISRFNVEFKGLSNHAGTTAMHLRKDALLNSSKFIVWLNDKAIEYSKQAYTVATVGACSIMPNAANVISNSVKISIDLRSEDDLIRIKFIKEIEEKLKDLDANYKLVSDSNATPADDLIIKNLKQTADELQVSNIIMPSGAGHDSAFMAKIASMGMIFIPSKNGLSHHPDEESSFEDAAIGTQIILNNILRSGYEK